VKSFQKFTNALTWSGKLLFTNTIQNIWYRVAGVDGFCLLFWMSAFSAAIVKSSHYFFWKSGSIHCVDGIIIIYYYYLLLQCIIIVFFIW